MIFDVVPFCIWIYYCLGLSGNELGSYLECALFTIEVG